VTLLNPAGSALVYSTYLGGSDFDAGLDIAVDNAGQTYVAGATRSAEFPTTPEAFDTTFNGGFDAFVAKISTSLGEDDDDDGDDGDRDDHDNDDNLPSGVDRIDFDGLAEPRGKRRHDLRAARLDLRKNDEANGQQQRAEHTDGDQQRIGGPKKKSRCAQCGPPRLRLRSGANCGPPRLRLGRCAAPKGGLVRALRRLGGAHGETAGATREEARVKGIE